MEMLQWRVTSVYVSWLLVLLLASSSLQAQVFKDDYDHWFKEYTIKYLYGLVPDNDWRWFKAQCYQESRLKPLAVSPAGATGLCQLMSGAAKDAGLHPSERIDPEKNIRAGAWILRRNIRVWWPRDTLLQRLQLGWAGYNAGAGHIIKAQKRCNNGINWPEIAPCLSSITGHTNAGETINYVILIPQWYRSLP